MVATLRKLPQPKSQGLALIEELTGIYADRRAALGERVNKLVHEQRMAEARALPGIKQAAAAAKDAEAALKAAIDANAAEFVKPRTRTFSGIKVGLQKLPGKLTFGDPAKVVALIKKLFPERQQLLIKTTETPVKDALSKLSGDELKRLGCSVGQDTDEVVVKPTDSEIEKVVAALLKDPATD